MGLRRQVIDLIRLHQADDSNQGRGIGQIPVMQASLAFFCDQMVDPRRIGNGGACG